MSSKLLNVVLAASLAGCAGSAPSVRSKYGAQPAVVSGEEACREPTALILLCGEDACAFYRCSEVALLENAPRRAVPYDGGPDKDARAKVVLALAGVEEEPQTLADDSFMELGHTGPVFFIHFGPRRPHPLPPGLRAEAERRARLAQVLHHVFPPDEEFRGWFVSKGIDPEDWTIPVVAQDYFGIHEGPQGDLWNAAWRELMRAAPQATATEIWSHAGELCLRFGLFELISDGPTSSAPRPVPDEEAVAFVGIDPAVRAQVDKALAECAALASQEVLARRFNGRTPTPSQCFEEVGRDAKGRPTTLAQQFGIEMHEVALECARRKLGELRQFGFSIEPRYRYNLQTGRATPISPEMEQELRQRGLESELLGTIVPDVVLHAGNPAKVQDVYDFKFPCVDPEGRPKWRKYPDGHPYEDLGQDEVYQKALGPQPARVTPRRGVIR